MDFPDVEIVCNAGLPNIVKIRQRGGRGGRRDGDLGLSVMFYEPWVLNIRFEDFKYGEADDPDRLRSFLKPTSHVRDRIRVTYYSVFFELAVPTATNVMQIPSIDQYPNANFLTGMLSNSSRFRQKVILCEESGQCMSISLLEETPEWGEEWSASLLEVISNFDQDLASQKVAGKRAKR